ncbi:MAG TPA: helix-turn-helix domain-containing protein [Actinomycetota bacterium]|nr:helix-turn-helix domain-containing protein [Actinomycetota bacterium]
MVGLTYRFRTRWQIGLRYSGLPPTVRLVAHALATWADQDGANCRPAIEQLQEATGRSRATVCRALRDLERRGWIVRARRGGGRGRATEYGLRIPPQAAARVEQILCGLPPEGPWDGTGFDIGDGDPGRGNRLTDETVSPPKPSHPGAETVSPVRPNRLTGETPALQPVQSPLAALVRNTDELSSREQLSPERRAYWQRFLHLHRQSCLTPPCDLEVAVASLLGGGGEERRAEGAAGA